MERVTLHLILHFLVPMLVARVAYKKNFYQAWLIMSLMIIVDLDHLLATPVFDPLRCSIGFHPLHSYYAIGAYFILSFIPKTRVLGIGLLLHILIDLSDCAWMKYL